ncbi:MAG: hypothetical protein KJ795_04065 [Gammaproteobacteria bacterium]|nr:hypothetical protein [Gammaproteobacteria bacterium]MBU1777864.1 hypothetical protein [Gammaproteobacteria bacterium]MBU1968904.1 hypothetical protein [Gammaproteobacteria bacterium]
MFYPQGEVKLAAGPSTVVLCDKRWLHLWKYALIMAVLFMATTAAVVAIILRANFPDTPWVEMPALLIDRLGNVEWGPALLRHLDMVLVLCVLAIQILYLYWAQQRERLTLSPAGISYTSPLPPSLRRLKPDWSLSWREVSKIEFGTFNAQHRNLDFVLMTLFTATGKQKLFPAHWVDANSFTRPPFRFSLSLKSPTREEIFESAMASAIMRYITKRAPQVAVESTLGQAVIYSSLEKDPHGRKALFIVAALVLYAIVDFVAGGDSYIDEPAALMHLYIAAGVLGALLAGAWLYRSALPSGEKAGLAFLIGVLVAVAFIPGALRLNALTSPQGFETYDYYVTNGGDGVLLRPAREDMPVIEYFANHNYWKRYGKDDPYPVQIRKGGLGFYQFNSSAIVDDIHRHDGR